MLKGSSGIRLDLSPHPPSRLVLEMVKFVYRYEFPDAIWQVASNKGHLLGWDGIAEPGMEFLFGQIDDLSHLPDFGFLTVVYSSPLGCMIILLRSTCKAVYFPFSVHVYF